MSISYKWTSDEAADLYQKLADTIDGIACRLEAPRSAEHAMEIRRQYYLAIEPHVKEMTRLHSLFCFPIITIENAAENPLTD